MSHSHDHAARHANRRKLAAALALTGAFTIAEVVGGLLTGSLALLADAGHMLSDTLSLTVALWAAWLAGRPATPARTFGYRRAEILAALFNGVTLVAIAIWIFIEAAGRFSDPPDVPGGWLLAIAVLGLLVNAAGFRILHGGAEPNLNVRAAARHVFADMLGSIGVIVAALIILTTGWALADPLVSVAIGALVLFSSYGVLSESVQVLLEGSPRDMDVTEVGAAMAAAEGIVEVHDLHVWTITSGFTALSAHIVVGRDEDCHSRRHELDELLAERFGIDHSTLQVEHEPGLIDLDQSRPG